MCKYRPRLVSTTLNIYTVSWFFILSFPYTDGVVLGCAVLCWLTRVEKKKNVVVVKRRDCHFHLKIFTHFLSKETPLNNRWKMMPLNWKGKFLDARLSNDEMETHECSNISWIFLSRTILISIQILYLTALNFLKHPMHNKDL